MSMIDILIPTLESRADKFNYIKGKLQAQIGDLPIRILSLCDSGEVSTGIKRNALLQGAEADYVCFVDDDDDVSDNYIEKITEAARSGLDCASLLGLITFDGRAPKYFIHSIIYENYSEGTEYYRPPNHLNLIRRDIARKFEFPDKYISEDTDWALQISKAKALRTEFKIPDLLYFYKYVTKR